MITKYNGYSQSLSDVLSVFLFYNSYCNTINSVEKYINKPTNTYEQDVLIYINMQIDKW